MRTVYLGTSEFAAGVLRALAASAHRPVLVLSRPDRPRGRGRRTASPPVVALARELAIPVLQPDAVNDPQTRSQIAAVAPERLIVCAFGALVREPLLSQFGTILNVHPSLLPRWRGAAPIERAILAGDAETGVSIMGLTAGLDSGPVYLQAPLAIDDGDDYGALAARLVSLGAELLVRVLDAAATGREPRGEPQDDARATYAEKLDAEDRLLDPARPAAELARRVRALSPHIGARLELEDGSFLGVWRACPHGAQAGTDNGAIADVRGLPTLVCSDGMLSLEVVQPPGRRRMSGADWLRGWRR